MQVEDNLRAGMSPEEARRTALVKLGGLEQTKQAYRERGTVPFFESVWQDLRFALRQFAKNPGFACIAVFILALGLGASIAIFAFVDATLLKPLPYGKPSETGHRDRKCGDDSARQPLVCRLPRLEEPQRCIDFAGRVQPARLYVSARDGVQLVPGTRVSDGFFKTLGVTPILGRDFYAGEDLPSSPRAVMLSYTGWQKWFGGRSDVLGQAVTLSGHSYTIVGVLPRDFQFALAGSPDFWTTLHVEGQCDLRRSCHSLTGVGRLKDGVSIEKAETELKSIATQLEKQYPDSNRGQGACAAAARGGCRRRSSDPPGTSDRSGAAAADRMRECCQLAAGALGKPPARDGRTRCHGRNAARLVRQFARRLCAGRRRHRAGPGIRRSVRASSAGIHHERLDGLHPVPERIGH